MQDTAGNDKNKLLSYKVIKAMTLSAVAAMHGTTPQKIANLNRITSTYVFPGQTLIIPQPISEPDSVLFETQARHVTADMGSVTGNLVVTMENVYFEAEQLEDVNHPAEKFRIEQSISSLISLSTFSELPEGLGIVVSSDNSADRIYVRLRFMKTEMSLAYEFWLEIALPNGFELQRYLLLSSSCASAIPSTAETIKSFVRVGSKNDSFDYFYKQVLEDSLFDKNMINQIFLAVPPRVCCENWRVFFSTLDDGYSLMRLIRAYRLVESSSLIVIQDIHNKVFGIYLSHPLQVSKCFYGTGETFLFSFHPSFNIFRWSGGNDYFIKCSNEELIFGASEGHYGMWIDNDLCNGTTAPCSTFDNQCLTISSDFVIKKLEVWSYTFMAK